MLSRILAGKRTPENGVTPGSLYPSMRMAPLVAIQRGKKSLIEQRTSILGYYTASYGRSPDKLSAKLTASLKSYKPESRNRFIFLSMS